jgi:hypothetical protein
MKPLFKYSSLFLLLFSFAVLIIFSTCSKQHDQINKEQLQKENELEILSQINSLTSDTIVSETSKDSYLINKLNPYEIVGKTTERVLLKVLGGSKGNISDLDSLKSTIISQLKIELPESVSHVDTIDYIKFEDTLKTVLLNLLHEGYNNFVSKSKQIENIIICSDYLNDIQKKRFLIFSSVQRHNIGAAYEIIKCKKRMSWDQFANCWIGKATALSNCSNCTVERFLCKVWFAKCYSVWAADCLLSMI